MNQLILNGIIQNLAATRPFFYSEADFQHSLAFALKTAGYNVFLEHPVQTSTGIYYIDIILEDKGSYYPIELKYKTKVFPCSGLFCPFSLKNQGANDIGRYQFWEDVHRIEHILGTCRDKVAEGYVIMLTNDKKYWEIPSRPITTNDQRFRIHPGMNVRKVDWNNPSSTANRYPAFHLSANHIVPEWQPYSKAYNINHSPNCEFKFLTITVK